jgi:hypothetical protein
MQLDFLLADLYETKQAIRAMTAREAKLRRQLHEMMNARFSNSLETGQYLCIRDVQEREHIGRDDIPTELWDEYARVKRFPVLKVIRRA